MRETVICRTTFDVVAVRYRRQQTVRWAILPSAHTDGSCVRVRCLSSPIPVITLRASCDAVYCNRSCLFVDGWVCVFVCGVGLLVKGSDHLQLIKFWPSPPREGSLREGANIFGSALLQPARSVCVSSERFCSLLYSNTCAVC